MRERERRRTPLANALRDNISYTIFSTAIRIDIPRRISRIPLRTEESTNKNICWRNVAPENTDIIVHGISWLENVVNIYLNSFIHFV